MARLITLTDGKTINADILRDGIDDDDVKRKALVEFLRDMTIATDIAREYIHEVNNPPPIENRFNDDGTLVIEGEGRPQGRELIDTTLDHIEREPGFDVIDGGELASQVRTQALGRQLVRTGEKPIIVVMGYDSNGVFNESTRQFLLRAVEDIETKGYTNIRLLDASQPGMGGEEIAKEIMRLSGIGADGKPQQADVHILAHGFEKDGVAGFLSYRTGNKGHLVDANVLFGELARLQDEADVAVSQRLKLISYSCEAGAWLQHADPDVVARVGSVSTPINAATVMWGIQIAELTALAAQGWSPEMIALRARAMNPEFTAALNARTLDGRNAGTQIEPGNREHYERTSFTTDPRNVLSLRTVIGDKLIEFEAWAGEAENRDALSLTDVEQARLAEILEVDASRVADVMGQIKRGEYRHLDSRPGRASQVFRASDLGIAQAIISAYEYKQNDPTGHPLASELPTPGGVASLDRSQAAAAAAAVAAVAGQTSITGGVNATKDDPNEAARLATFVQQAEQQGVSKIS